MCTFLNCCWHGVMLWPRASRDMPKASERKAERAPTDEGGDGVWGEGDVYGWEVGRVVDCQMFPLSLTRFWYWDRDKVRWGEEMRGKDGERLNEGRRDYRGELPGRMSESDPFFFQKTGRSSGKMSLNGPILKVPSTHLFPPPLSALVKHPIWWCPHLFDSLHWHILVLHVKGFCATDCRRADAEYALCMVENGFKGEGTLLPSLWEGRW